MALEPVLEYLPAWARALPSAPPPPPPSYASLYSEASAPWGPSTEGSGPVYREGSSSSSPGSTISDIAEIATPCIRGLGKVLAAPFLFAFHVVVLSACTAAQFLFLTGAFLCFCTDRKGSPSPPLSDAIFLSACFQWAGSQWQKLFSL